jgi:hypothetical protein
VKKKKPQAPLVLRMLPRLYPLLEKTFPNLAARLAFYLFFTPFRYKAPMKEEEVLATATPFAIAHNGLKVQCYEWGQGPVVIMLHGWSGRAGQFRKFVEPFTQGGFRVVAIDAPGHGKSEGKRLTILDIHGVLQLLHQKYNGFAGIIGHSFGGASSLFALSMGIPATKLIMIGSPTRGHDIIADFFAKINGGPKSIARFEAKVLKKYGRPFDDYSACAAAPSLPPIELLLVHDEGDKEVKLAQPLALKSLLPSAQIHITQGLGHYRILKDPEVVSACLRFVQNGSIV